MNIYGVFNHLLLRDLCCINEQQIQRQEGADEATTELCQQRIRTQEARDAEDALYDTQALRHFVGIDQSPESAPDATTLLKLRHLLEYNKLTAAMFEEAGRSRRC